MSFLYRKFASRYGFTLNNSNNYSRSGAPPLSISHLDHDWISRVNWTKLDALDPSSYKKHLSKTDVLVHSLGILLETNYKASLGAKDSILQNLFQSIASVVSPNPMQRTVANSYDSVNRKSAVTALETYLKNVNKSVKVPTFVYISADKGFPGLPSGYINSKRQAERELVELSHSTALNTLILRPGFMYDEEISNDLRSNFKSALNVLNSVNNEVLMGKLSGLIRPTISTQQVSHKILSALENEKTGILLLEQLIN